MSYEKCKNIILKPKTNQIFITSATNNDRPLHYYKSEYTRSGALNFEDKLLNLMLSMIDGNIQISQLNKHTIPFEYALLKLKNYYREKNIDEYGEKFDSAHNEYLQYLITIGLAGLIAYLSLLITSIVEMIRKSKAAPFMMGIPFALICYGAQAAVNISVPIVAPVMMTLLMVGVAALNAD